MPRRNSTSYTTMIAGLSRSGFVAEACKVFDSIPVLEQNVFSWTAMISSYPHNRQHIDAHKLFSNSYGEFFPWILPNSFTFSSVLNSCLDVGSLVMTMQLHGLTVKILNEQDKENVFVQNCLIDLHSKLGNLGDAEKVFNGLIWKDLSTWYVMMDSYARNLMIDKALVIFDFMEEKDTLSWNLDLQNVLQGPGTYPNSSTFTIALTICGTYSMLKTGIQLHACVLKRGLTESNSYTGNSLINILFYDMHRRCIILWNSLILGLRQNGHSKKAIEIAEKALSLGILTTIRLVDEGIAYFGAMSKRSEIEPFLDHYVCWIDMLGRAGKVVEAHNFLRKMPISLNAIAWTTLLNACLVHGNKEIGEVAARKLRILEPSNSASYVMLGNLYRKTGHFEESRQILELMNKIDLKKEKGISWNL
ncbi:hypothetical protein MKX01_037184 [Papaver californicum]|nr:hypothetical protein MKX01_037184 [Papaver californicum]